MTSPYGGGLERNAANYTALTPVSFLAKAAGTYPERVAIVHGELRRTWKETYARCRRLASALARRGVKRGETVAAMLPNVPAMIELHFGPAMFGAVLNTLNTRLDAEAIAFMLDHGEAKVLFTDREFSAGRSPRRSRSCSSKPLVIDVDDAMHEGGEFVGSDGIRGLPRRGRSRIRVGVSARRVGRHRAQLHLRHDRQPEGRGVPLPRRVPQRDQQHPRLVDAEASRSTSGRCRCSIATAGASTGPSPRPPGTNVCLRKVEAKLILDLIREHKVTHYCGAPIVHSMLLNAPAEWKRGHRARGPLPGGRRAAAGGGDRGHGRDGIRHHPRVRAHRDLRPGGGVRQASRVERASARGAGHAATAARAWPTCCRKAWTCWIPRRCSRCPGTARPWARSCSAATSP